MSRPGGPMDRLAVPGRFSKLAAAVVSAAVWLAVAASPALACPGCIEGSGSDLQAGFVWSGLLMMATPYFVFAVIGGGLFLAYRRSVRREVDSLIGQTERDEAYLPLRRGDS